MAEYHIDGDTLRLEARRNDRTWGHCIDVDIFSEKGELWTTALFACHPEFPGYAEFQNMSTNELLAAAIRQLESGGHERIRSALEAGIKVIFRLNGEQDARAQSAT